MDYINSLLRKWMPCRQRVAVDSKPKLHGIFDTINATVAASDSRTRLPNEFYDAKLRKTMDRILVEEEYSGYRENEEYRRLGIGHLLSEVAQRMSNRAQRATTKSEAMVASNVVDRGDLDSMKLALFACHDSTLAATLTSLGTMEGENSEWPGYASSLAIELFQDTENDRHSATGESREEFSAFYVRLRYNERPLRLPGCQEPGDHWEGDKGFCTLVSL